MRSRAASARLTSLAPPTQAGAQKTQGGGAHEGSAEAGVKIVVDARELRGKPTGVGRYLAELFAAWKAMPAAAAHEFVLFAPDEGTAGTLWEQVTLPQLVRRAGADVLFSPAYTGPLLGSVPMVVAIHDVSYAAHPEWFPWREGLRRRMLSRLAARRAARVLTISEFSKQEIVKHLGVDPSKVTVTYLGVTQAPRAESGAPDVLFVGSIFSRRHVPELMQGFAGLAARHADARLTIVGDNRTTPQVDLDAVARASGSGDRIRIRSYVTDEELRALYRGARAFVFLSDYEGFGLTPLEALSAGIPIVVLDTPVAREIYGPAAVYLPRPDPALVDAALERMLFDEAERARLLDAAATVLARYSWQECAHRTLQVLLACAR
jgi:glycosyltransferase involved in cell wall biosynthesis